MKIAVPYLNGEIFQHFGHTAQFKIYEAEDGKITYAEVEKTMGSGHGALAGMLAALRVDAVICGGIGGGARMALSMFGIKIYGGVQGSADAAAAALAAGELIYDPNARCEEHEHGEGHACSGSCGSCGGCGQC